MIEQAREPLVEVRIPAAMTRQESGLRGWTARRPDGLALHMVASRELRPDDPTRRWLITLFIAREDDRHAKPVARPTACDIEEAKALLPVETWEPCDGEIMLHFWEAT
ncbi:hypothetical protein LCGC14_2089680 [marine sediment metagenome]|uniref:Uncharacterized protein n=1 Tax=marine sediment metagenome TaxID=412755 RepID=A0A0F9H9W1_9ZZZZ